MKELLKKQLKQQKGFTLIELLAVIVILAIIMLIAIPAVGTLMDNSQKDAHIANAQQLESAAKLYFTDNRINNGTVSADTLKEKGYLDDFEDPSGRGYSTAQVTVETSDGKVTYKVKLEPYFQKEITDTSKLTRDDVTLDLKDQ